jgi:hypothetical protein
MTKMEDDVAALQAENAALKEQVAALELQVENAVKLNAELLAIPRPTPLGGGEVLKDGTERAEGAIPQPISVTSTTS